MRFLPRLSLALLMACLAVPAHAVFMEWRCGRQRPDHAEDHRAIIPSGHTWTERRSKRSPSTQSGGCFRPWQVG